MKSNRNRCKDISFFSNITDKKPYDWKVVNGKKRIYFNSIDINVIDEDDCFIKQIDSIKMSYHITSFRNIDLQLFEKKINNKFKKIKYDIKISYFYRDGQTFPYITAINIIDKYVKQYFRIKKLKNLIFE